MPDDFEFTDGLAELARLCDEHGLEHMDSEAEACKTHIFIDRDGDPHECWGADGNGKINVTIAMTPEQAVTMPSLRKLDYLADVYLHFAVMTLEDNDKMRDLILDMWRFIGAACKKYPRLFDPAAPGGQTVELNALDSFEQRMRELGVEP